MLIFVTYRFLKLLTTPFKKTDAFKLGIIDEKGHRILKPKTDKGLEELNTAISIFKFKETIYFKHFSIDNFG